MKSTQERLQQLAKQRLRELLNEMKALEMLCNPKSRKKSRLLLQQLDDVPAKHKRSRGMSRAAREVISKRMKAYWAKRRKEQKG